MSGLARRAAAALLLLAACATVRGPGPGAEPAAVAFPPEEVRASGLDAELQGKTDEELFAVGTAAHGAGDFARAAAAFARLADLYPGSPRGPAALLHAGLAYERLEEWRLALERFRRLERTDGGAVEASFRVAECQYHLRELADARATLDALAARPGLGAADRVRALTQRGIVELEDGRADEAERSLRLALAAHAEASGAERLDGEVAAQAQFYLGEVYREAFRALPLDPSRGDEEALDRELERTSELLLSAQGHYLRAIRMGSDRWALAAGFRIGELYDELRGRMLEAPPPAGLTVDEEQAYRAELRARVRVLATKAIAAYEQTLSRAARASVDDLRFLRDAQASLERLRTALAEELRPGS